MDRLITQALRRRQGGSGSLRGAVADPTVQELGIDRLRKYVDSEAGSATPPLRRHSTAADPLGGTAMDRLITQALHRRQGGGLELQDAVADPMCRELGIDTSTLRMRVDPEAGTIARSLQADAFTYGNDIYFAPGSYQPASRAGQRILAHELGRVAAQRSGTEAIQRANVHRAKRRSGRNGGRPERGPGTQRASPQQRWPYNK